VAKTVTLKAARPGRDAVRVDDYVFYLGRAVRNVPEDVVERLRAMPGVQAHVTASTRKAAASSDPEPADEAADEATEEPEPVPAPPTPEPPTAPEPTPESSEDD
jgi:hypothetical protein